MSFRIITSPLSDEESKDFATVVAKDGTKFAITKELLKKSKLVSRMLEDTDPTQAVELPCPETDGPTLSNVFEFLVYHDKAPMKTIEKPLRGPFKELVDPWDFDFFQNKLLERGDEKKNKMLQQVICAANFLIIEDLRTFSCAAMGSLIMNKSQDEIFDLFGAKGKITQEHWEKLYAQFPYMRPKDQVKN
eukprot:PhF_6_TR8065/c0_g1_i1/m.12478/K03094/SKP1, CBF3D; S-phase kinase-associated protein 1